ncbi:MAG: Uma2 family endonuclease [Chloroflexi bacterium]|nr:Uma2 family endonuclease [Chloroflexota bacterium]
MSAPAEVEPVVAPVDRPGPPQGAWTYDDYCALPDDGRRYEIIDGVLYMTPSPKEAHQAISALLTAHLMTHVQFRGRGRVYAAPFDVRLGPGNVVQPDVIVVRNDNLSIITPDNIVGAPDLVIEIASPSTTGYDRRQKQDAYAAAGVDEYWLIDPAARTIEVLRLEDGAYRSLGAFRNGAQLPSIVVPDLPVPVAAFFG